MSDNKSGKSSNNASAGLIAAAVALIPMIAPKIIDHIDKRIEEREKLVSVPELYSNRFPLTAEQAVERLKNCGLSATLVKASINDASPKYRNCFNSQVILSRPKSKQKVAPGSGVSVKYITQEVIEESQRIFEENKERRAKQKEETSKAMTSTVDAAKRGFRKISSVFGKKEKEDGDE